MDIIFKGGNIVDGTGRPGCPGDMRISDGRIVWVGNGPSEDAAIVDVSGCVITPGFVDFHAHTDMTALANPTIESKLSQGVTLEVNGNCGFSDAPIINPEVRTRAQLSMQKMGIGLNWNTMGEMLDVLENHGLGLNFVTLVGHANIRREVIGQEDRPASADEIRQMQSLVEQAMEEGAFGLSTGLIYPPSCYGSTEEISQLCGPVAKRGGMYATHMRSEADHLTQSVDESIEIGKHSGAKVQISHLKACGTSNHGKTIKALEAIEKARKSGINVTADQYPYIATCTGLDTLIPAWAHSGGNNTLRERLQDKSTRQKIASEIRESLTNGYLKDSGGLESIVISSVNNPDNRWMEGLDMAQIAERLGKEPVEAVLDLLMEEDFGVGMVHFCLSEEDVQAVMSTPHTLFGSDATARSLDGPMGKGKPHPRAFGTFPRILSKYVRQEGVLSLETAVQKMTSLATERLGIKDRGWLKPGYWADIVVFKKDEIQDSATFVEPQQLSAGIVHVLVNGRFALRDGKITGLLPGKVLRSGA